MSQSDAPQQPPIRAVDLAATAVLLISALLTAICCGISALLTLLLLPFDRRRKIARSVTLFWIRLSIAPMLLLRLWRIELHGLEHRQADFRGVYAPNHSSQLDILILHAIGLKATWVSKSIMFWMPFIGWAMLACGYIGLKRNDAGSIRSMTRKVEASLRQGIPVVIFPEGTRARAGTLLPFKVGAFQIARRTGADLQPLAVEGTGVALPPKSMLVRGGITIRITFLPVVTADQITEAGPENAANQAREQIADVFGIAS